MFFEFLHTENETLKSKDIRDVTLSDLESLKPTDIEQYLEYLSTYDMPDDDQENSVSRNSHSNSPVSKRRKLSALNSFYKYFYKQQRLRFNPAALVTAPKVAEKKIIRLDAGEVASLLDNAENGTNLTKNQLYFHEKTKLRDVAILTLFLSTGIRISELVSLNISDMDFNDDSIIVTRKGSKVQKVFFSDEAEETMLNYLEEREQIIACEGHDTALFLSFQKKRISVRAVENLVKKYAGTIGTNKKISPHKLRSTYGTALYQEEGDIYLVAEVLGHSDVNTTKKHYAAIEETAKQKVRNSVHLRKD